ncbi:MAG: 1,4-dihydroxy-2-naphthoate polyprenyltransferase [Actinomycetota bacterium]|nr:1,4-dihydroxy-2-naphthoate polyprenyltransferase [Actinomycetota bacterium]
MNRWLVGARLRTLPAAVVPVAVGAGVAAGEGTPIWWRAGAALVVSLALQVGTNFANDYSDGVRGTDADRVGPTRLVASGLASPREVLRATLLAFTVAAAAGLLLAAVTTWWLVALGAACLAAGWFYTGGSRPYGYAGLGDVAVFVFFGLVAVAGTTYVLLERLPPLAVAAGVPVGALAVSLLVANNLRDLPTDRAAGKLTSAVRLGDRGTRVFYTACLGTALAAAPLLAIARPGALIALLAAPLAAGPVRGVRRGASGLELLPVLAATGRLQLAYGLLLAVGLAL